MTQTTSGVTTSHTKLSGQALLDYVDANSTMTHTELCTASGYIKDLKDGNKGCDYIAYYEAIIDARNGNKIVTTGDYYEVNGADWYEDVLDDQGRELYDMIESLCPEFAKLDANQCQEFMDELSEHGINDADTFESALFYQTDAYNAEADFAQYVTEEVNCMDMDSLQYLVIDWQATWDTALCYDFFTIEFDGETYFFSYNF